MKKSYLWEIMVEARCPCCWVVSTYDSVGDEGDIVTCHDCNEQFQLGKQE